MEILNNYVETMFRDFSDTEANRNLKASILESMTEKYNDLMDDGKTDAEALGVVLAQFGDIEELKEAYEVKANKKSFQLHVEVDSFAWPLVVVTYLIIGVFFSWWHPGWLLFPVTALLLPLFKKLGGRS